MKRRRPKKPKIKPKQASRMGSGTSASSDEQVVGQTGIEQFEDASRAWKSSGATSAENLEDESYDSVKDRETTGRTPADVAYGLWAQRKVGALLTVLWVVILVFLIYQDNGADRWVAAGGILTTFRNWAFCLPPLGLAYGILKVFAKYDG